MSSPCEIRQLMGCQLSADEVMQDPLGIQKLDPGDQLLGLNGAQDLDRWSTFVTNGVKALAPPAISLRRAGWQMKIGDFARRTFNKKQFWGPIKDILIVIAPPSIEGAQQADKIDLETVFSYLAVLKVVSTGRDNMGYVKFQTDTYLSHQSPELVTFSSKNKLLKTEPGEYDVLAELRRISQSGWNAANLSHQARMVGGFGGGKRR